jgi:hypothetical protein
MTVERSFKLVHIHAIDPETGVQVEDGSYGFVATAGEAEVVRRCTATWQEMCALVGDIRNDYHQWQVAIALAPSAAEGLFGSDGEEQIESDIADGGAQAWTDRLPASAVKALRLQQEEARSRTSQAFPIEILELDDGGEAFAHAWYGVEARGRFGSVISRETDHFDELEGIVGVLLSDEKALWEHLLALGGAALSIGTWDGQEIDPVAALLRRAS